MKHTCGLWLALTVAGGVVGTATWAAWPPVGDAYPGADDVLKHIQTSIPQTIRTASDDGDIIGLPHPYTAPCAKEGFQQLFYWDTYFINLGLIQLGQTEQARHNTDNLLFLLNRLGCVPNANRLSMANRSQTPFLSQMVRDVFDATGDKVWLRGALDSLQKEYTFWMTRRMSSGGLNRPFHSATDAYLLNFYNYLAQHRFAGLALNTREEKLSFSGHALAEAELWDFTPRFDRRAADFCPVDLNAVLYAFEENMAYGSRVLGRDDEKQWMARAERRRALVQRLLWNDVLGCYVDYDAVKREQADLISAATLFPLAAGMATPEQAERVVRVSRHKLECAHGIATCEERKHPYLYQWDYPNGWPCLQVIAIQAFDRYGFHAEARRIAEKYVNTVIRNFRSTGDLWEKYNVVTGTIEVADEYPMPRMVGWTAGAFVFALDYLMQPDPKTQPPKKDGGAGR